MPTLFNKKAVQTYIKENSQVRQISSDFWPALEARMRKLLDAAVKRNGNHPRITHVEIEGTNGQGSGN